MILDTDKVMADTLARMDAAYSNLRTVVADEGVLNRSCREITNGIALLHESIDAVINTRNVFHEMKRFVGETKK